MSDEIEKEYRAERIQDTSSPLAMKHMSVGQYIATRIPSLKPPMDKAPNPIRLLAMLNFQQWMFFLVGFIAVMNRRMQRIYEQEAAAEKELLGRGTP